MSLSGQADEPAQSAYDALAPHYREYAAERSAYLSAVDRFIVERMLCPGGAMLDIGAGDGVRGMALARELGVRRVVLCEPSCEMAARCRELGPDEVWEAPAERLPQAVLGFDIILCLWNVLGHLPGREARLTALAAMRRLLKPRGAVFLDVNNRHNAGAYGRLRVLGRRLMDFILPDERRGDAAFAWMIGGGTFPAMGHLFTPAEIEGLLRSGGLRIVDRIAVDYATGAYSRSLYRGHLLYQATLAPDGARGE